MKKKIIMGMLFVFICLNLEGCGKSEIKEAANEDIKIFSDGDIEDINNLIFGTGDVLTDFSFEDSEENNIVSGGILDEIFSHSVIELRKISKNTIQYKISSPDMSKVFEQLPDDVVDFTKDDLYKYIQEYVTSTEVCEFLVEVPYSKIDSRVVINYRDESFINAITGGLLEAYKTLYRESLDRLKKEDK